MSLSDSTDEQGQVVLIIALDKDDNAKVSYHTSEKFTMVDLVGLLGNLLQSFGPIAEKELDQTIIPANSPIIIKG